MNRDMLIACVAIVFMLCLCVENVVSNNNKREIQVEAIRIEKEFEIEVTKQKAIQEDKSRKRKVWEREMSPKKGK